MISVDKVTVRYSGVALFNNFSFLVNPKDRIGLVGKNGAGKSTLFKVMVGITPPDEGQVTIPDGATLGYLPQQMKTTDDSVLVEEVAKAFGQINEIEQQIEKINRQLAERTDYETDEYLALCDSVALLTDRFQMMGGANRNEKIGQVLKGLGFTESDFEKHTATFSGGWRMRVELAKILLQMPSVLLLDEPTNHLDIESIQWLEDFLKSYNGAVLIISHDRAFLNNLTRRTLEISMGKLNDFNAPYSEYVELRKMQREQQMAAYKNQQKFIEETEAFIERFRYKATKAVQVQSRIKQLEKIERLEVEEEDKSAINVRFPDAPRSGRVVYKCNELVKKYGNNLVLDNIDFAVERGEKIAFVGKNGEGKSTLSKIIIGALKHTGGESIPGKNVSVGYFAQNQDELMDDTKTVFQTIDDIAVDEMRTKVRDLLGAFLFSGQDVDKKVKVLSGGEKSRLAMAKLMLQPHNLLVLDEPTNHLDMLSKDILKQALVNFNGTLIVVSHDREFLTGLTHKVYEFKNKKIHETIGDVNEFLRKKKIDNLNELERKNNTTFNKSSGDASENKMSYLERKELDKDIRKVKNQLEKTEANISRMEDSIALKEKIMAAPDKLAEQNEDMFYKDYRKLKADLDKEMEHWEEITEQLTELNNKKNNA